MHPSLVLARLQCMYQVPIGKSRHMALGNRLLPACINLHSCPIGLGLRCQADYPTTN